MVLLGASCISAISAKAAKSEGGPITIFITGDELGALKPCGCSGGQLGGLDRRGAILGSVAADKRLVLDTGNFIEGEGEQDQIKFSIVTQALGMLGYDAVRFTGRDIEAARNQGMLQTAGEMFAVISDVEAADINLPAVYTKKFVVDDANLSVNVAAIDLRRQKAGDVFSKAPTQADVNILIVNDCNDKMLETVKKTAGIDCLICPAEGDEPIRKSKAGEKPLVMSVGRLGKYVTVLKVKDSKGKASLDFEVRPVAEDLPQEQSLVELYRYYQQIVKDAGLLERHPRLPLPENLSYTGSNSCKPCHMDVDAIWSGKKHAHAYATLEKVGSQYDPECVVCHVVGMDYESGFVNEKGPEDLRNVGCENCHGAGSEHNKNPYNVQTPGDSWASCVTCHTTENSAGFAGHEQEYLEKIRHWTEQKDAGNVK
jgi:hypothetical protein